jgi:hypothetical protein
MPAGLLAILLLHIAPAPVEHRWGKHVVIDLVEGRLRPLRGRGGGAQDALCGQGLQHLRYLSCQWPRPTREVVAAARHLAAAGGHQPVEKAGAHRLGGLVQAVHHLVEMAAHDRLCPAQGLEVRQPQHAGCRAYLLPQPGHHQLQEGNLDLVRLAVRGRAAHAATHRHAAHADLLQQGVHQAVLDLHRRLASDVLAVPDLKWAAYGLRRARSVEVPQAQPVAQQVWDALLEAVQFGQAVFAHREDEAHIDVVAVDGARELGLEGIWVGGFRMVDAANCNHPTAEPQSSPISRPH